MVSRRAARGWMPVLSTAIVCVGALGCHKNGPPQHYDDPKEMIQVFENRERDSWQQPDKVVRALPIASKGSVVADIGAGSGYFTRRLAQRVPEGRVYAVDVDGEFADYLLEQREGWGTPNIEPQLAMYDDPMLPAGEIDFVFTANTYSYIRDRVAYFTKVKAALRPGGKVAVLDFRPDAEVAQHMAPEPKFRISRDQAVEELGRAGFKVIDEPTFLSKQWFLVLEPTSP